MKHPLETMTMTDEEIEAIEIDWTQGVAENFERVKSAALAAIEAANRRADEAEARRKCYERGSEMTAEELEVIRKQAEAAMKAAPGEWECDGIDNEDGHGKFRSYAVYLSDGRSICDTLNSSIIEIEEEADEYGVSAFDRIGAICMEFIAAANPVAVLALLSALDAANRRADEAEAALELRRGEYRYIGLDGKPTTARALEDRVISLRARVAELEAGGCARDQGTTQYCAEAVALQKRVAELEVALQPFAERATRWEENHPIRSGHQHRDSTQITHRLGDFRAARKTLGGGK